ncbi:nucleotidyltransferase family protein [Xenophilus arseniciresistens]|uniref:Nucleotidyltransferase family protein n=1 Tax=Xenophilus arseniciresistens TaxID=1283306 RepID=A0AAE3N8T9_9BURK|nr:nucleotidyltransferase family protein [Xenophilus arseniciresistens]MDA7417775.1 nucleotidyltransferase family protein [Xenophilus arseniciresistens]
MMPPAIVLAGGFGTRLRSVVSDVPKPLAPVAGKPFLWWLLRGLEVQGVREVHLCTGYMAEKVAQAFGERYGAMQLHYSVETQPLGTGGAVVQALSGLASERFFVLNGDTLANVDLRAMQEAAQRTPQADAWLCGAQVEDAARYGTLQLDAQQRIVAFEAKGREGPGVISAGIYLMRRQALLDAGLPGQFSIEQDFFEARLSQLHLQVAAFATDFIDIGVPEDYTLAQTKIPALAASA